MKKTIYLFLYLLFASYLVNAQGTYEENLRLINVENMKSPSPDASSLGKYVEYPVELYTGVPSISIPIFEIKTSELTLPVSISYHASGIKVEENANSVGLGWSLNAGGVITRVVKGLPDDTYKAPCMPDNEERENSSGFMYYGSVVDALCTKTTYTNEERLIFNKIASGKKDGEPDLFYFNFAGYTGEFFFNKEGEPQVIPQQKMKISYSKPPQGKINQFEITTANGIRFIFADKEETSSWPGQVFSYSVSGVLWPTSIIPFVADYSTCNIINFDEQRYYSSWYLSKIVLTNGEEINYSYTDELVWSISNYNFKKGYYKWTDSYGTSNYDYRIYYSNSLTKNNCKKLSSIAWNNGQVAFTYGLSREDIITNPGSTSYYATDGKALTKISLINTNNELQKYFDFNYSYFLSPGIETVPSNQQFAYKRLKLLSVQEKTGDIIKPAFTFDYNQTSLPNKYSWEQDFWGYYNASNAVSPFPTIYVYPDDNTLLQKYQSIYSIYPLSHTGQEVIISGENKLPNETSMEACILTQINFPTGGYEKFDYEPNIFYFESSQRTGGGLRIKESIVHDAINSTNDQHKVYTYPLDNLVNLIYLPQYASKNPTNFISGCIEYASTWQNRTTLFSNSQGGLGSTHGCHIGYRKVQIETQGTGTSIMEYSLPAAFGDVTADCTGSDCIYNRTSTFINSDQCELPNQCLFPFPENPNYDWNRGLIQKETHKDASGRLVKEVIYEYNNTQSSLNITKTNAINMKLYLYQDLTHFKWYKGAKYNILSAWKYLKKKTEILYDVIDNSKKITSYVDYSYSNPEHKQVTSISKSQSDGSEAKAYYKYPLDYTLNLPNESSCQNTFFQDLAVCNTNYNDEVDLNNCHDQAFTNYENCLTLPVLPYEVAAIKKLQDRHIIDAVIEKYQTIKQGTSERVVAGTFIKYADFGNGIILPKNNSTLKIEQPQTLVEFTPSFLDNNNLISNINYTQDAEYSYNTKGKIASIRNTNNISSSYIWGYNNTYPVIQVDNIEYDPLIVIINSIMVPLGYSDIDLLLADKVKWQQFNIALRADTRLKNCMIKTFTYKPLIGIATQTDENNRTTYYEYDTFGRLKEVRDNEQNVVKRYDYHYKGQTE